MLDLLASASSRRARAITLGAVLGLIGVSEIVFPGDRYPYMVHTLLVTFASLIGGVTSGVTSAVLVAVASIPLLGSIYEASDIGATLIVTAVLAGVIRLLFDGKSTLLRAAVAGLVAQLLVIVLHRQVHDGTSLFGVAMASAPANAFGVLLLQLIVNDAHRRADAERHRLDAERLQSMVMEAQLVSLRARIHPHFLFNALTSIAALCSIEPAGAETAIVRLSQLMRRVLESGNALQQPFADEIEYVRAYIEIEQHRFADRLNVIWEIDYGVEMILTPPFSLQILVENAVNHGISTLMRPGTVRIRLRQTPDYLLVAVSDDGSGFDRDARSRQERKDEIDRKHGIEVLSEQLTLLHGAKCRVRLLSKLDVGTIACFRLPLEIGGVKSIL